MYLVSESNDKCSYLGCDIMDIFMIRLVIFIMYVVKNLTAYVNKYSDETPCLSCIVFGLQ